MFFILLRVGVCVCGGGPWELRWKDLSIVLGRVGDDALRLRFPRSKTDRYNQGHVDVLKTTKAQYLRPVRGAPAGYLRPPIWNGEIPQSSAVIYANRYRRN